MNILCLLLFIIFLFPAKASTRADFFTVKVSKTTPNSRSPERKNLIKSSSPLSVEEKDLKNSYTLTFPFPEKTLAAIAQDQENVLLFFKSNQLITLKNLKHFSLYFKRATLEQQGDLLLLKIKRREPGCLETILEGNQWQLTLHKSQGRCYLNEIFLKIDRQRKEISLKFPQNPVPLLFSSKSGPTYLVIPSLEAVYGIDSPFKSLDLTILPSSQASVIDIKNKEITYKVIKDTLFITKPTGLLLSPVEDLPFQLAERKLFDFESLSAISWQSTIKDLREKSLLQDKEARIKLAHHYLKSGFDKEAVSLLTLAWQENKELQNDPYFIAHLGLALFLQGDLKNAEKAFNHPSLNGNEEAFLWRRIITSFLKETPFFIKEEIKGYPLKVRLKLWLKCLEDAINQKDFPQADDYLTLMRKEKLNAYQALLTDYLEGKLLLLEGKKKEAALLFKKVMQQNKFNLSLKAEVALLEIEPAPREDQVERFEKLRLFLRGEPEEKPILLALLKLYQQGQEDDNVILILKELTLHAATIAEIENIRSLQEQALINLLKNHPKNKVKFLAIASEFYGFTPKTPEGARALEEVADVLIEVNLIKEAVILLESLFKREKKAPVGHKLLKAYRAQNEDKKSLDLLKSLEVFNKNLSKDMRLLKAEALYNLKSYEDSLKALEGIFIQRAEELRLKIYQRQNKDEELIQTLFRLLSSKEADIKPSFIIKWAAYLYQKGYRSALLKIAEKFQKHLPEPYNSSLKMMSLPPNNKNETMREVQETLNQVKILKETFDSLKKPL